MNRARTSGADEFTVELRDAFPSFFGTNEEERVSRILANPGRPRFKANPGTPKPETNAVAYLRCLFEVEPGKPCGRLLRPVAQKQVARGYGYRSTSCFSTRVPHYTWVPGLVDDHVLGIVREVFTQENLQRVALRFEVESDSLLARRRNLESRLAALEDEVVAAGDLALKAQATANRVKRESGLRAAQTHLRRAEEWQERCDAKRALVEGVRSELELLAFEEQEFGRIADADLRRILALATDLPRILELARKTPGMLASLMDEIIHVARIRCLGLTVYELEVVFPSGESVRRIFQSGHIGLGQPVRAYCRGRLAQGATADEIRAEILSVTKGGVLEVGTAKWDAQRVRGSALVNEYFEDVPQRDGEHSSMEQLAGRTGASTGEVLAAALDDRLGPARWDERGLCCRPTDAELHFTFPEHARSEVATRNGLDPDALIAMTTVRQANRDAGNAIQRFYAGERWVDASGRIYVLKVDVERAGLAIEVDETGPDLAEIEAALRELGRGDVDPAEMLPAKDVVADLRKRFPFVNVNAVLPAIKDGRMLGFKVRGINRNGGRRKLWFVHVPRMVRTTRKRHVIEAWLGRNRESASRG